MAPVNGYPERSLQGLWEVRDQAGSDGVTLATLTDAGPGGYDGTGGPGATYRAAQINGEPALEFTSAGYYDTACPGSSETTQTVFAVCLPDDTATIRTMFGSVGSGGLQFRINASDEVQVNAENTAGIATGPFITPGVWQVLAFRWDAATGDWEFWRDGALLEAGNDADTVSVGTTTSLGANRTASANEFFDGMVAVWGQYGTWLDDTEMAQLDTTVQNRYGIAVADYQESAVTVGRATSALAARPSTVTPTGAPAVAAGRARAGLACRPAGVAPGGAVLSAVGRAAAVLAARPAGAAPAGGVLVSAGRAYAPLTSGAGSATSSGSPTVQAGRASADLGGRAAGFAAGGTLGAPVGRARAALGARPAAPVGLAGDVIAGRARSGLSARGVASDGSGSASFPAGRAVAVPHARGAGAVASGASASRAGRARASLRTRRLSRLGQADVPPAVAGRALAPLLGRPGCVGQYVTAMRVAVAGGPSRPTKHVPRGPRLRCHIAGPCLGRSPTGPATTRRTTGPGLAKATTGPGLSRTAAGPER